MDSNRLIEVVLSDDLLNQLRKEAHQQHVSLKWLVAGLVCDTLENGVTRRAEHQDCETGH